LDPVNASGETALFSRVEESVSACLFCSLPGSCFS
jgi:hypothetical protein